MSIEKLRAERAEAAKQCAHMIENISGAFSKEEQAKFDALADRAEAAKTQIQNYERELQLRAEAAFDNPELSREKFRDTNTKANNVSHIRAYLIGGHAALPEEEQARLRAHRVTNAQSVGTAADGGYTVQPERILQFETAMKAYGCIREAATTINTMTGANLPFPGGDATAETGELLAENGTATSANTTFFNVDIPTYKFSSRGIQIPYELLQDSFFDIESYVREVIAMRIGRSTAQYHATGTGSSQPKGIVTAASLGVTGATGNTVNVTYDALVDLQHSVDVAYRRLPGVGFVMNDATVKIIRKIKDGSSRPIFVPGYETNVPGGAPDTLLGTPIVVSNEMAVMAANAKSILYGCLKKYIVRNVMDLTILRLNELYAMSGQVGFIAFQRQGSNLVDSAGASVKYYANSAT